ERVLSPVAVRRDRARARGERGQRSVDRNRHERLRLLAVPVAGNEGEAVAPVGNGEILPGEGPGAGRVEPLEQRPYDFLGRIEQRGGDERLPRQPEGDLGPVAP